MGHSCMMYKGHLNSTAFISPVSPVGRTPDYNSRGSGFDSQVRKNFSFYRFLPAGIGTQRE